MKAYLTDLIYRIKFSFSVLFMSRQEYNAFIHAISNKETENRIMASPILNPIRRQNVR